MNLRQKYKKAKRELEFYRRQKVGNYTLVKREEYPVQTLCCQKIITDYCPLPSEVVEAQIREQVAKTAQNYVKIERDFRYDHTVILGTLEVIDRGKPMQLHDGMKIDFSFVDEEEPLFTKEQLWPVETYF